MKEKVRIIILPLAKAFKVQIHILHNNEIKNYE